MSRRAPLLVVFIALEEGACSIELLDARAIPIVSVAMVVLGPRSVGTTQSIQGIIAVIGELLRVSRPNPNLLLEVVYKRIRFLKEGFISSFGKMANKKRKYLDSGP